MTLDALVVRRLRAGVSNSGLGITANAGATLAFTRTRVEDCDGQGITLTGPDTTASFTDLIVDRAGLVLGPEIGLVSSNIRILRAILARGANFGLAAKDAAISATDFVVTNIGDSSMTAGEAFGAGTSTLALERVQIGPAFGVGLIVGASILEASDLAIHDIAPASGDHQDGTSLSIASTNATVDRVSVKNAGGTAMEIGMSGSISVSDADLSSAKNTAAMGVYIVDSNVRLARIAIAATADGIVFPSAFSGVTTASISDLRIVGSSGFGLHCDEPAVIHLENASFEGGINNGIGAAGFCNLTASNVRVSGTSNASATAVGMRFEGGASVIVDRFAIDHVLGAGLLLDPQVVLDGAIARTLVSHISNGTISNCSVGARVPHSGIDLANTLVGVRFVNDAQFSGDL
jgi:hypothetical protein